MPNLEAAVVPEDKIVGYLVSPTHTDGKHKAAFFKAFGFSLDAWQVMAAALLRHATDNEVAKVEDSPFGTRYVIEGTMVTPDGRTPAVRSVWFIESGEDVPRLATAYPGERTKQ
ncbi:MAG TPA: hypothetical protein VE988_26780 [Gemmataceae bacterium]|nr:hypothetical protein [Gemmataceae bacterium]